MYNKIENVLRKIYKIVYRYLYKNKYIYLLSSGPMPISGIYGFDRGTPIDRYYIENFLDRNRNHIQGTCLEVLNNTYTKKYGENKVIKSIVLDIDKDNRNATLISDIRNLIGVEDNSVDCIILTQVLQFIDNTQDAISECYRILKPGGVLLATIPSVSRIDCVSKQDGDFWRFTVASAKYTFEQKFNKENIEINSFGNSRIGMYFLAGLALEDTPRRILDKNDVNFPLITTVKAVK